MPASSPTSDFLFATPDQNGVAPECRISNASDAYFIANQLRIDDFRRDQRRSTVYRCFRGFAPTQYSQVVKEGLQSSSNVNWQMMKYRVNNQKSGYIDMVTDRSTAADIRTKYSKNAKENWEWSDVISQAYNLAVWDWKSYFPNTEITIEEMLLNGKGIEIRDEKACWYTRSYHNNQILVPDGTRTDLTNLEEWAIKDSYKPVEFWNKFKNSKGKNNGWNFWACLEALRTVTGFLDWRDVSNDQFLRKLAAGDINLNRFYFKTIDVYILFVKEYDDSITKMMVLREYGAISLGKKISSPEKYLDKAGFLYVQKNYEKNGWENIIYPFYGACGSGLWHDISGFAEDIYPQCRQYDILTNSEADALRYSMMPFLKAPSSEATRLLKTMEIGNGVGILPDGVDFAQKTIQIDIRNAEAAKQSMMADMDRGTASYGMVQRNGDMTAEEARLNFAQANKLDGTELRRFNICQTHWHWGLYSHLVKAKEGWKGYDQFKLFKNYCEDAGVPEEAWQPENIDYFDSNFLSVTGANKIAALQQVAGIAGSQNINDGEATAKRMLVSSLIGRQNVDAVMPKQPKDIPDQQEKISRENQGLNDPNANPENFQVSPYDNDLEHIRGHFSDAMYVADQTLQFINQGIADDKFVANQGKALLNKGAHLTAHINKLSTDKTKKSVVQGIAQNMEELKGRTDEILSIAAEMSKAKESDPQTLSKEQLDLQYKAALASLKLDYQQQSQNIKLATKAESHEQRQQIDKGKAALDLAKKRLDIQADAAKQQSGNKSRPKPVSDGE